MADVWLDIPRIMDAIRQGAREGLEETGDRIAAEARRRAPIRKVFRERKGFRRRSRALTASELAQATARASAYYGVNPGHLVGRQSPRHALKFYEASVQLPRRGSTNSLSASRNLRLIGTIKNGRFAGVGGTRRSGTGYEPGAELNARLTSRGKYEVRSGRAIHVEHTATGSRVHVGGALKASIGNEGVVQTGHGQEVTVSADIGYAKYVEFPTFRTAAQPFLLPALHGERERFPRTVAEAISRRLGG